jgi:hypothetical protein
MALGNLLGTVDGLLGTVDGLLGGVTGGAGASTSGGDSATASASNLLDLGAVVETSPAIHIGTDGGLDGADVSVGAPTMAGLTADVGNLDVGGLLHGLV